MSASKRRALERVDSQDPTLAVDGLSAFLPLESDLDVDPGLAVSDLHEFFVEEHTVAAVTYDTPLPPGDDAGLDAGSLADYFDNDERTPPAANEARAHSQNDPKVEEPNIEGEDPGFQSEIQRAAVEFQLFAEKFHAFASQCQRRRAL